MPKIARALTQLPPATAAAIEKLGADLAVARLRRKESLRTWAQRMGVTVSTLQRLESGDPSVGIGIVATALWLIQRDGALGSVAAPEYDQGAIEMDVRAAVALGRARAKASAEARLRTLERRTHPGLPPTPPPAKTPVSVD
jgi:transcriptional regulator with XRE-family HTH domain